MVRSRSSTMQFINWRWTLGVEDFPDSSGMTALVVDRRVSVARSSLYILAFGALVGMIGSGIAASRFLDVDPADRAAGCVPPSPLAVRRQFGLVAPCRLERSDSESEN